MFRIISACALVDSLVGSVPGSINLCLLGLDKVQQLQHPHNRGHKNENAGKGEKHNLLLLGPRDPTWFANRKAFVCWGSQTQFHMRIQEASIWCHRGVCPWSQSEQVGSGCWPSHCRELPGMGMDCQSVSRPLYTECISKMAEQIYERAYGCDFDISSASYPRGGVPGQGRSIVVDTGMTTEIAKPKWMYPIKQETRLVFFSRLDHIWPVDTFYHGRCW